MSRNSPTKRKRELSSGTLTLPLFDSDPDPDPVADITPIADAPPLPEPPPELWPALESASEPWPIESVSPPPARVPERWFRGQAGLSAEGPLLPAAAEWLVAAYGPRVADVVLVVPGRRAGRRLRYLLATKLVEAGIPALAPRPLTPGELPELLYARGQMPVASPLACRLAWIRALRESDSDDLLVLTRRRPESEDLVQWGTLADQMAGSDEELAAAGHDFESVRRYCATRPGFRDVFVWDRQARLHRRYRDLLEAAGLADKHEERRAAWRGSRNLEAIPERPPIVLIGCHDLNRLTERLLDGYPGNVVALIDAPPEQSSRFDRHGSVDSAAWTDCRLSLRDEQIVLVDQPHDQVEAAVEALAAVGEGYSIDDVTIAAGDPALIPVTVRVLDLAGIPARAAERSVVAATPPALLLEAVADHLVERPRWQTLTSLIRHPDLRPVLEATAMASGEPLPPDWLERIDEFTAEHLPFACSKETPRGARRSGFITQIIKAVETVLVGMKPPSRPLSGWALPTSEFLATVYGGRELVRGNPSDAPLYYSLNQIGNCLKALNGLSTSPALDLTCDAAAALRFILKLAGDATVPDESGQAAVELLGWLEAPLDDAPVLVVIGCNEGAIPKSVVGHSRLPEALRSELGLPDNARYFARDAASLAAMARSRRSLTLIAGRRSADGDPLAPSRLLLAADEETVVRRAVAFFDEEARPAPGPRRLGLKGRDATTFAVPRANKVWPVDKPIPVTAFRQYLKCPYQFYLGYVEKLQEPDDREMEMDAGVFGNLAHHVLAEFARCDLRDSTETGPIETFVEEMLRKRVNELFGRDPEPAVLLQRDQLAQRLRYFARAQADRASQGWRIMPEYSELDRPIQALLDAENQIHIQGRIDRIERHIGSGCIAIIDYKTADTAKKPEQAHREKRDGELHWIDLQLPLYRLLAETLGLESGKIQLAYFNLPADEGKVELASAEWTADQILEAHEKAREIARKMCRGVFPPSPPDPRRLGDFTGIRLVRARGWKNLAREARRATE